MIINIKGYTMHIVLIHPPQGIASGRKPNINPKPYHFPPGILTLASACESAGHLTEILDFPMLDWRLRDFETWLDKHDPDVIAISFCSPSISFVKHIALKIRHLKPQIKLIYGGPHVTFSPDELLQENLADYIVRNEGEVTFPLLLQEIEENVAHNKTPGISFKNKGEIIHNLQAPMISDLDSLPMAAYHLLDMKKYKQKLNRIAVASMRGCPFACKFCTITPLLGDKARVRSEQKLFEELKLLSKKYDIPRVSFTDPNFALSQNRLQNLLDIFHHNNFEYKFGCQTRLFTLTDDVLSLLKALGCGVVFVGIESGSSRMLAHYNKDIEKRHEIQIVTMIEKIKKLGFEVIPSFIIGSPEETIEDIDATISLARKIISGFDLNKQTATEGGNFQLNMFGPFPGVNENILPIEIPLEFAPAIPICSTKHVSRTALKDIWRDLYQEFNPEFYDKYCEIEKAAEQGVNIYLEDFISPTIT